MHEHVANVITTAPIKMTTVTSSELLSLPSEVQLQIFKHLQNHRRHRLAPYSTIHRSLTPRVESLTFRHISLNADTLQEDMGRCFFRERREYWWRRMAVKVVTYTVRVPEGTIVDPDQFFTSAIENLFSSLHQWELDAATGPNAYRLRNDIELFLRTEGLNTLPRVSPIHSLILPDLIVPVSRLRSLPNLTCISSFYFLPYMWTQNNCRLVSPGVIIDLAGALGGTGSGSGLRELVFLDGLRTGMTVADIHGRRSGRYHCETQLWCF